MLVPASPAAPVKRGLRRRRAVPKGKVLPPGKWKEAEEPGWFLFGELGVRRVEVGWGVGVGSAVEQSLPCSWRGQECSCETV